MMLRAWNWYQKCMTVHPVKTQVVSSGFLWGLGDIAAQTITHATEKSKPTKNGGKDVTLNWKRVATVSMFGFGFIGPIGHFWYESLDNFVKIRLKMQPKSMRSIASKVALDGLIFGPLDLLVFFSYMGFASGKSINQVKEDIKLNFFPALALELAVWPVLQVANFKYIPVRYHLLYVNIFCLLDSAFLSWLDQQNDAAWKQWFASYLVLQDDKQD